MRLANRNPPNFVIVFVIIVVAAAGVFALANYATSTAAGISGPLISYSADAYASEVSSLLANFSRSTGIPVAPVKSGGSFADANQIAAGAPDDLFVSASLSATAPRYLKNVSSNWAVGFATDQMVIAYSNETSVTPVVRLGSIAMKSNSSSDWSAFFSSLTSGKVKVGIADPVADPAGFRGWIVLQIAGFLYASGNQSAYAATLIRTDANVSGAHAAALVAPLQSGQIQFLLIYKSAAIADGLSYIQLDGHVNLGDPTFSGFYSKFSYADSAGAAMASPIIVSVTVPLSSNNAAEAFRFVRYIVLNAGSLRSFGLQPIIPSRLYNNVTPPEPAYQLLSQGLIIEAGGLS
jgi:molybdate/tungstate transport system substrate-binding protein